MSHLGADKDLTLMATSDKKLDGARNVDRYGGGGWKR